MNPYFYLQIVKSLDTFLVAGWYFLSSTFLSKGVDLVLPEFKEENYKDRSVAILLLEIVASLWLFLLVSRLIRVVFVDFLYSPFEGAGGYQRKLTKEATGGVIFAFSLFSFSTNLKSRVTYLGKRIGLLK
jgi:hypothetical protein